MSRRAAWLVVLAMVSMLATPALAPAQPPGTLVVGLVAEPVNLDPAQVTDLNSNRVGRRVVETLVTFPEESTQIVPGLAESWTVTRDGLRYTFKLRKGIAFHDGTPFNAEAVKFSIERQIVPEHPFSKLGKYPFANYFFGNVKAVEVVDEQTVQFVLKEPRASFLAVLSAGAASIVSPTAVKKAGADYALTPVGTGPFKFVQWDRGQRVMLEKNATYWKHPVKLERVIYRPIVEDQARLTELLTGTLDLIVGVPPDFVGQLENNAEDRPPQAGGRSRLVPRHQQPEEALRRQARAAGAELRGEQGGHRPRRAEGHRGHLRGAGATGDVGRRRSAQTLPLRSRASQEASADAGSPQWLLHDDVGAGVGVGHAVSRGHGHRDPVEPQGRRRERGPADHGMGRLPGQVAHEGAGAVRALLDGGQRGSRHGDVPPAAFHAVDAGRPNRALYKNERYDELLHQARLVTDQAKRAEAYREAQRILYDDAPWIFIDHEVQIAALSRRVQGFKLHPSFDLRVETISLK